MPDPWRGLEGLRCPRLPAIMMKFGGDVWTGCTKVTYATTKRPAALGRHKRIPRNEAPGKSGRSGLGRATLSICWTYLASKTDEGCE